MTYANDNLCLSSLFYDHTKDVLLKVARVEISFNKCCALLFNYLNKSIES